MTILICIIIGLLFHPTDSVLTQRFKLIGNLPATTQSKSAIQFVVGNIQYFSLASSVGVETFRMNDVYNTFPLFHTFSCATPTNLDVFTIGGTTYLMITTGTTSSTLVSWSNGWNLVTSGLQSLNGMSSTYVSGTTPTLLVIAN
eukprot:PhF_6_TR26663/c0_g1_i3/m.38703